MKRMKACRRHITEIYRDVRHWENQLHIARHIGSEAMEAECQKWIHLLIGEIDGIKWVMYGNEPEEDMRTLK